VTGEAAQEAARKLAGARDDPRRRLDVAAGLYGDRPGGPSIQAYRRAELAFMRWQVSRGVLTPLDSPRPGSAWWRAVNEDLLRDAREARYLVEAGAGSPSHRAVTRWVQFLERPSPRSWYRAHNASIVAGYVEHRPLADGELPVERFFMDVALGRVLFVHILVTSPSAALGRWLAPMGRPLGDPRWRGADLYLSMRNVLPDRYPLSGLSIAEVLEARAASDASSTTGCCCHAPSCSTSWPPPTWTRQPSSSLSPTAASSTPGPSRTVTPGRGAGPAWGLGSSPA